MALLAVAVDMAVLEITPHLEHFRSSRLFASAGTLWTCEHTHTHIHTYTYTHRDTDSTSGEGGGGGGWDDGVQVMATGGFCT